MKTNDQIIKEVFMTDNLDVYFYEQMIKCMEEAKKEVFDDIEDSDIFKEHISKTDWYNELKTKHLGELNETN